MSNVKQRVRQAFDEVKVPEKVKRQTLAAIENARPASESCASRASAHPSGYTLLSGGKASHRYRHFRPFYKIAAAAACFIFILVCFGGLRLYTQPSAYVGIDVNPSVELSVNRFGIVIDSKAFNTDGQTLLASVSLTHRQYADALKMLIDSSAFAPYAKESSFLAISVTSDNAQQAEKLRAQSDERLSSLSCGCSCSVVDAQTRQAASAAGMGVGRYRAALELMELDPDMTLEGCATLSMHELRDRIEKYTQDNNAAVEGTAENPNPGSGHHGNSNHANRQGCSGSGQDRDGKPYGGLS